MQKAEHGYLRSQDGVKLFYATSGPQTAYPLCFCYGLVCSKLQWKYQWNHFAKTNRVLYFDYRGHNRSELPEDKKTMTITQIVDDIADMHEQLKLPPLVLLGHSLGVNIVLEMIKKYPEKVKALVLTCGTPRNPFESIFQHNFTHTLLDLADKLHEVAPNAMSTFWQEQGKNKINLQFISKVGFNTKYAKKSDIEEYLRITSTVPLEYFLPLAFDLAQRDECYWLDQIKKPTLIIGGSKDLITPADKQKIMHQLIEGSQLQIIPEGSHCVQMEQTAKVNKLIENFIKTIK